MEVVIFLNNILLSHIFWKINVFYTKKITHFLLNYPLVLSARLKKHLNIPKIGSFKPHQLSLPLYYPQ